MSTTNSSMRSLWQGCTDLPEFPNLTEDISTDILVIGGGMAGLLTAYTLKSKGFDVVLAEKERICCGTTTKTTAKITAQHGFIYQKILKACGKDYARMYYDANSEAVSALIQICSKAGFNPEIKDNYIYSSDSYKLEDELKALEKIGAHPVYLDDLPVPVLAAGAVGLKNQGQFNPLRLAQFLSKNLRIYENTKVSQMIGTTAITQSGRIRAKKVIVTTHFPFINKHGFYFLKLYQHRSYMLAMKNTEPLSAMYVDEDKKGFSFSFYDDYLLLGGGGHRTGKQGGGYRELRNFSKLHYKNARECFHWAAQDTMSLDGIPYIGNYSRRTPDLYVAAGFNKWGMTGSMVSAEIISSMIEGKPKEYASVFDPSRSILKPQLFINGFEAAANLLFPTTRRCPHLGCALKYNKDERSWDCACHGSRFSESGKLLDNPANDDLRL